MYVHTFLQYNVIRSSIKRGIRLYDFELTFSYEIVFPFSQQIIKKVICSSKTICRPIYDVLNLSDVQLISQNKCLTELNLQEKIWMEICV